MHSPRPRSPVPGYLQPPTQHRRSALRSRSTQLHAIRFGWVVLVIWYEVGEFFYSLSTCRFPDRQLRSDSGHVPKHVVLVADPHVPHPIYSHPEDGHPWVNAFRQRMEELFMRKSWNVVRRLGRIDAVVFLGDMLDYGIGPLNETEYEDYHTLFKSIFKLPARTNVHFVPGNHDIPLAVRGDTEFTPMARRRYESHFGEVNTVVDIAGHTFILLDAVGLIEEDYRRYYAEVQYGEFDGDQGVVTFVKNLGRNRPQSPILITHVPLNRRETLSCGPYREGGGQIRKGVGPGYQNLLGSDTSKFLLEAINPAVVFSGDDHDYCDVTHPNGVREVTVKTFSSDMGIRRPGLQLLSLVPPEDGFAGYADVPCILPDQIGVYTRVYPPFAILTFLFLLFTNIRSAWARSAHHGSPDLSGGSGKRSPVDESNLKPRRMGSMPGVIPSRRSAQHLQALAMSSPRERHAGIFTPAPSVPSSPLLTPRTQFSEKLFYAADDPEDMVPASPSMSRRSSFASEFGYPTSSSRSAAANLLPTPILQPNPRRASGMPRMLSATDWVSAARAKDVSVLSLVADHGGRRVGWRGGVARVRAWLRWLWRARNGVFVKTWREAAAIAIPAALTWAILNGLFFWESSA